MYVARPCSSMFRALVGWYSMTSRRYLCVCLCKYVARHVRVPRCSLSRLVVRKVEGSSMNDQWPEGEMPQLGVGLV